MDMTMGERDKPCWEPDSSTCETVRSHKTSTADTEIKALHTGEFSLRARTEGRPGI